MIISPILGFCLAGLVVVQALETNLDPLTTAPNNEKNKDRKWRNEAVAKMWKERKLMAHTPLKHFKAPGMPYLDLIFKDESASRSGNLKHRFSWGLFMWGLLEGFINENTTVYEASSGNTATSEAFIASIIGVPFIAVIPDTTEITKIQRIEKNGGQVLKADSSKMFEVARDQAAKNNGFYMNQFANAEKAEEFHESGISDFESTNVMHEILVQFRDAGEKYAPHFFVHSAGTGGTITSAGRYIQKYGIPTQVVLADTQYSMYYDYVIHGRYTVEDPRSLWVKPGMAGTGFGYAGPAILGNTTSLLPAAIDQAYKIPDLASTAAMHILKEKGINGGTSTGVNFITSLSIGATQKDRATDGRLQVVTILSDSGTLYESSYYNETWIEEKFKEHGGKPVFDCWKQVIKNSIEKGGDPLEVGVKSCKKENVKTIRARRSALA